MRFDAVDGPTGAAPLRSADAAPELRSLPDDNFTRKRPPMSRSKTAFAFKITARLIAVGALAVATGQAALHFAFVNLADHGGNIVSVPQLYGTTHTLLSHILPRQGIQGRFADNDSAEAIARLIDADTRAVFCETIGNPAGNVCDIEKIAGTPPHRVARSSASACRMRSRS